MRPRGRCSRRLTEGRSWPSPLVNNRYYHCAGAEHGPLRGSLGLQRPAGRTRLSTPEPEVSPPAYEASPASGYPLQRPPDAVGGDSPVPKVVESFSLTVGAASCRPGRKTRSAHWFRENPKTSNVLANQSPEGTLLLLDPDFSRGHRAHALLCLLVGREPCGPMSLSLRKRCMLREPHPPSAPSP